MRKGVDYDLDTAGITGLIHPGEIKNYLANVSFRDMSEIVGLGHVFARLILKVKTDEQSLEMIGSIVKGLVSEEQLDYLSRFSSTLTHRIDLLPRPTGVEPHLRKRCLSEDPAVVLRPDLQVAAERLYRLDLRHRGRR